MPDAHDIETLAEVLAKSLAEHEVNLRFLWRDLADKDIEHGVDWPGVVRALFADMDRIVQARAGEGALRERIEAVLPSPESFAASRRRIKATYTSATESGMLLGCISVEEALVNKVRAALDTAGDQS